MSAVAVVVSLIPSSSQIAVPFLGVENKISHLLVSTLLVFPLVFFFSSYLRAEKRLRVSHSQELYGKMSTEVNHALERLGQQFHSWIIQLKASQETLTGLLARQGAISALPGNPLDTLRQINVPISLIIPIVEAWGDSEIGRDDRLAGPLSELNADLDRRKEHSIIAIQDSISRNTNSEIEALVSHINMADQTAIAIAAMSERIGVFHKQIGRDEKNWFFWHDQAVAWGMFLIASAATLWDVGKGVWGLLGAVFTIR